ncbi:MAG: prepilin-type N-terminal cleavage/methylation domain-containing protein, partial [Candidatus Cloacimonadota bacterium]
MAEKGYSLTELLVSVVIIAVGLLTLATLMSV